MQLKGNNYKPNEILKFIREASNKTQKEFAEQINKSKDWQQSNELGRANYLFKDLLDLCNKNNIEILFVEKNTNSKRKED